jgi:ABC-2 type transport system permease protein
MSPPAPEAPGPRRGVIHDLGYRPYEGVRHGEGWIAQSLFLTGLRNAYGLGRSGRSKILPILLLVFYVVPTLGIVVAMVMFDQRNLFASYPSLPGTTTLLSVFAAAQAPILFSRDLRYGSIVLYLARPLRAAAYAVTRWLSLAAALIVFLLTPMLLLYVGSLLSDANVLDETKDLLAAVGMALLLAGMVAGVAGLISAWSTRRGFAVVATIAVLLLGDGIISAVQAIAREQDASRVGEVAGLLSPYRIHAGLADAWLDTGGSLARPDSMPAQAAYLAAALVFVIGGLGLLVRRYRKVAGR